MDVRVLGLLGLLACASPRSLHVADEGSGVECNQAGGYLSGWQLDPELVPAEVTSIQGELTLDAPHPHEKWRPLVFLALDGGEGENSVRIELFEPRGSAELELNARVLTEGKTVSKTRLATGLALGEKRIVSLDWSSADHVAIQVDGADAGFVPLPFPVVRITAGCSSASARVWVPTASP